MLGGSEITRCFLADLANPTGQVVRVTNHDVDQVVGADSYVKTPGFNLSRYTVKNGGEAATIDFEMPLSDDGPILVEDEGLDFTHGKVTWTSGANAGATGWVRQWTSGTGEVAMVTDFPFDIEAGDDFNVLAGCKKNRADCAAYDNIDRYGGFDFVAR
jgi:hypothetical protein